MKINFICNSWCVVTVFISTDLLINNIYIRGLILLLHRDHLKAKKPLIFTSY